MVYEDGYYYYINSSYTAVRDRTYAITCNNGLLPSGTYTFDSYGRMLNPPETTEEFTVNMAPNTVSGVIIQTELVELPAAATETHYSYVYNGSQLVQMSVGSDVLWFAYDASGAPMSVTWGEATYLYVTNVQGDVIAILDTSGNKVVEYTYDAWGNILSITGSMAATLGQLNPLRYRSYVYDPETGLYYLQSRYYNPEWGRFINADTFAATGQSFNGNNMFAYCGNNPITRCDSSGDAWETVWDIVSLVSSVAEVAANPTDPWAWAGLIGDVVDVALPGVGGLGEAARAIDTFFETADAVHDTVNTVDTLTDGIKYTDKVLNQMSAASDLYHSFPTIIDTFVDLDNAVDLIGGDKVTRKLIQFPGSINGKDGIFEYIIDFDGWCNHRLFKEWP